MVTDAQIQQWLRDNPNATDAQVLAAMDQYGVTPQQLASATGTPIEAIMPRINAVRREETIGISPIDIPAGSTIGGESVDAINRRLSLSLPDQFNSQDLSGQLDQIRTWVAQNPTATAQQINSAMQTYGISPQKVALAMGATEIPNAPPAVKAAQQQFNQAEQAFQTVAGRVGTAGRDPMAGQVADWQVQQFLRDNPNLSDAQVLDAMVRYGVTPAQMARATGVDINSITRRIAAVEAQRAIDLDTARRVANPPATGLIGYEQAAERGVQQATNTLQQAQQQAVGALTPAMEEVARLYGLNIDDLRAAEQTARGDLGQSMGAIRGLYGENIAGLGAAEQAARGDLGQSMGAIRGLYGENIAGLGAAGERARTDLERTFGQAGAMFSPYQQAGSQALQRQLALSGALGQDAFNQAYQESPYIRFLREQGERSTLAGAAATGGLGGGRVQQELVRFGQGLAGQGLQQQIGNLSALSGMGFQATGAGADILTGLGTNLGNVGMNTAQNIAAQRGALAGVEGQYGTNLANLATGTAQNIAAQRGALAGIEGQYGTNLANLATGTAQNVAGQRQGLAGERSQFGTNLANLATSTGTNIANLQAQTQSNIANQRMQAGQLLAGQIGGAATNLGNLATAQGADLSNLLDRYGLAGVNLAQGYTADQLAAYQNAMEQEALAQTGYATNQANLLGGQQFAQAPPYSYSQAIGNALNAGALGYQLGQPRQQYGSVSPSYGMTDYRPSRSTAYSLTG
jgi:uncharacterized protein YneF (UPF0154 family)